MTLRDPRLWAGLGMTSLLIGTAYVVGGFLPRHELYLLPAAVAVLAVALFAGISFSTSVAPFRRLISGVAASLAVLAVGFMPVVTRWACLVNEVRSMPMLSDAYGVRSEVEIPLYDLDGRPLALGYATKQSTDDAAAELARDIQSAGWETEDAVMNQIEGPLELPALGIAIPAREVHFASQYAAKGERRVHLWVADFGDYRQVLIVGRPRPKPAILQRLGF